MSDPTDPADAKDRGVSTADATADTGELAPVPAADAETDESKAGSVAGEGTADGVATASAGVAEKPKSGKRLRAPWVTVGGAVVVLLILAVLGYVWGLGPLNRLNTERGINPPAKLVGLDRVTDQEIRSRAQLDQTRDALSRINNGKKVMVEAYGSLDGDRFYVLIALRGRVDIDKVIADSGATPDKVKKVGRSTCIETAGNLPTQCYRGSNTLTVIAQSANEGVGVDQVAPVAEEAFKAMK
jgi:hypothetical protein